MTKIKYKTKKIIEEDKEVDVDTPNFISLRIFRHDHEEMIAFLTKDNKIGKDKYQIIISNDSIEIKKSWGNNILNAQLILSKGGQLIPNDMFLKKLYKIEDEYLREIQNAISVNFFAKKM